MATSLINALSSPDSSVRLQAALAAGTHPDAGFLEVLIQRCAIEPDFFVRDMLTWALTRHPSALTVPRLLREVAVCESQARSQALHTLSKIGDPGAWSVITRELPRDPDNEVARAAWRAAVALVPSVHQGELATTLASQLGRGDSTVQLSLSQALAALGDSAKPALVQALEHDDPDVRAHALATERIIRDPDAGFESAIAEAKRTFALKDAPLVDDELHADR